MARAKLDGIDRSAVHLLHRASQCVEEQFGMELGDTGLTPRQLAIMTSLADNEGVSQTALVDLTGVDRSTLADIVRRLQKRGWLQRRRTREDARAYAVKLTPEGWDKVRQATPLAKKVDELILRTLLGKGGNAFIEHLRNVVSALEPSHDHTNRPRPIPHAHSRRPRRAPHVR